MPIDVFFDIDALYYFEAERLSEAIEPLDAAYVQARAEVEKRHLEMLEIERRYEALGTDSADEIEPLAISMESFFSEYEAAARDLAAAAATAHILCASCLEAHINIRAALMMEPALVAEFHRFSAMAKWIFYPRLRGLQPFDPGKEPLQGIQALASRRNRLLHFKSRRESHDKGFQPSSFIEELELRAGDCAQSLRAVRLAVSALAQVEGRDPPTWLERGYWPLFRSGFFGH